MEPWRSAERLQECRLWSTLALIGAVLVLLLLASILLTAATAGSELSTGFYLQQSALLALSIGGTVVALRRWRGLRKQAEDTSRY